MSSQTGQGQHAHTARPRTWSAVGVLVGWPVRCVGWVWRHRRWSLAVLLLALGGTALGVWRHAENEWERAKVALEVGKPDDARQRLKTCETVWPFNPEVQLLAARAARLMNDYPAAEAHLNRCRKLQGGATPGEAVQLEFLLIRLQGGELDDLENPLGRMVEEGHPDSPAILETLAIAFIRHHRYLPAHLALTKWIELRPDTVRAYQLRGLMRERLNLAHAAMEDYQKAVELDPNATAARRRMAEMYLEDKKPAEAAPHLEYLIAHSPADPLVRSRLGVCRFYQGEFAEARRLLEATVGELPKDVLVLIHLARLDTLDGRYAEAEQRLKAALALDPSDTEARYALVEVYRLSGRAADEERELKEYNRYRGLVDRVNKLLKDKADSPSATADDLADIAGMFFLLRRDQEGMYWLNKALDKNQNHPRSRELLAAVRQRETDPEAAQRVFVQNLRSDK